MPRVPASSRQPAVLRSARHNASVEVEGTSSASAFNALVVTSERTASVPAWRPNLVADVEAQPEVQVDQVRFSHFPERFLLLLR